tara:strand:- start:33 stop:602 length:570 start_codon:yes stop_codon:yes gene_type:complete
MDSRRVRNLRNNFDRHIVDKKVDKIFETGRQLIDGVSGKRPGKRRNSDFQEKTNRNFNKVGRWVSEKVDLFFDEENEDWYDDDNFYEEEREIKTFKRESSSIQTSKPYSKRPLEALSLRQPKSGQTTEQKKLPYAQESNLEDWPDELDFKVNRWQRSSDKDSNTFSDQDLHRGGASKARNLPRSRRRRV